MGKRGGGRSQAWLKGLIGLGALLAVVGIQRSQLSRANTGFATPQQAEQQEHLNLQLMQQMPTFGFDNLAADWAFLNFLQYYGDDEARKLTGYHLAPEYFDVIVKRDPRFIQSYMFLSHAVSYQLGLPRRATALMQRGGGQVSPQDHPDVFLIWRYLGLDKLLLEGDTPGAIQAFDQVAKTVEGTPHQALQPVFKQTADFLRKDPNSRTIRIQAWGDVFVGAAGVGDRATVERARKELAALGMQVVETAGKVQLVPIAPPVVVPSPAAEPQPSARPETRSTPIPATPPATLPATTPATTPTPTPAPTASSRPPTP